MTGDEHPDGDSADDAWHTYRMDPEEHPTEAVLMAVAAVRNVPVLDLARLSNRVDTDALDLLFSGPVRGARDLEVRFTYAGCAVEVTDSVVRVRGLG